MADEPTKAVLAAQLDALTKIVTRNQEESAKEWIKHSEDHKQILAEAKKTNGSVANLKLWRAYLAGFSAAIALILLGILPMVISAYQTVKK